MAEGGDLSEKDTVTSELVVPYVIRIEELEKDLQTQNLKLNTLCEEIKYSRNELSREAEKHQSACEARDENQFKIMKMEKEMSVLREENKKLLLEIKQYEISKRYEDLSLKAQVSSYTNQIKQYDEKLKACQSQITELQASGSPEKSIEKTKQSPRKSHEDCQQILQLENDIKLLSLENKDLKLKLEKESEIRKTKTEHFELQAKTCTDKLQEYKLIIMDYESKIGNFKSVIQDLESTSEKQISEIKNLQDELETQRGTEKRSEEMSLKIAQLQSEIEIMKLSNKKQSHAASSEIKTMPATESVSKEVIEIQDCRNILKKYSEQHRNLQITFEQEIKDKLLILEDKILNKKDISYVKSPISPKRTLLLKEGKPEKYAMKGTSLQEHESVNLPTSPKDSDFEEAKYVEERPISRMSNRGGRQQRRRRMM